MYARDSTRKAGQSPVSLSCIDEAKESLPSQKAEFANNIDETVAPFLDILKEAGRERERLALEAGAEVAKQLHPFSLVAVAMLAGIILGRILKRGNLPPA